MVYINKCARHLAVVCTVYHFHFLVIAGILDVEYSTCAYSMVAPEYRVILQQALPLRVLPPGVLP